ncbi:hypothetical protein BD413DRAFT_305517 [Trametes elegans]|nr:hypothetical protein BD413DRAFT_305517 [Trametes elegans]
MPLRLPLAGIEQGPSTSVPAPTFGQSPPPGDGVRPMQAALQTVQGLVLAPRGRRLYGRSPWIRWARALFVCCIRTRGRSDHCRRLSRQLRAWEPGGRSLRGGLLAGRVECADFARDARARGVQSPSRDRAGLSTPGAPDALLPGDHPTWPHLSHPPKVRKRGVVCVRISIMAAAVAGHGPSYERGRFGAPR